MAEWTGAASQFLRISKMQGGKNTDPRMAEFRWMLEELRVSLFAQELRTPMPVSAKRLQKVWESLRLPLPSNGNRNRALLCFLLFTVRGVRGRRRRPCRPC